MRVIGLSCVQEAYIEPQVSSYVPAQNGLFVDFAFAGSQQLYRLHNAQDRLRDLVVRVYAPTFSNALYCSEYIMDVINADVTIGGTCIYCILKFEDTPRYLNPEVGTYFKDMVFDVRLRRDVPL